MMTLRHVFHRHEWVYWMETMAEMPKDTLPEPRYMRGNVSRCSCGAKRFKPLAKGCHTVGVDLVDPAQV